MFPRPTAEPDAAIKNPKRDVNSPRGAAMPPILFYLYSVFPASRPIVLEPDADPDMKSKSKPRARK